MKKIYISGVKGNMGRRYKLICKRLGLKLFGSDCTSFTEQASFCLHEGIDGIIVATPTYTHVDALNIFSHITPNIPVLVEKPIQLGEILVPPEHNVTMVNQYKYLVGNNNSVGITYYNYFKTGGDGLLWDCINIIGMAKSEVTIKNSSLLWGCVINGKKLRLQDMDKAYVEMVKDWTEKPVGNHGYIEHAHKAVMVMSKCKPAPKTSGERNKMKAKSEVIPILGRAND
jgi:hypothetical protein